MSRKTRRRRRRRRKNDERKTLTSSIQAGFVVTLSWPSGTKSERLVAFFRVPPVRMGQRESKGSGGEDSMRVDAAKVSLLSGKDDEMSFESTLQVRANVRVWVNLNLPLRPDVSRAINFPPIRILLEQAGALMTKTIVSGIAPTLVDLLKRDYETRRLSKGTDLQPGDF